MTQPTPPPAGRGPEVNITTQLVPGADGKARVLVQLMLGDNAAFTMILSDAVAGDLARKIGPVLAQAAAAARQANMGLIVPGNGHMPPGASMPLRRPEAGS